MFDILTSLPVILLIRTLDIPVLLNNSNLAGEETSVHIGLELPKWPI